MQGRSRIFIIIAFIVIVVGVGAAFLLRPGTTTPPAATPGGSGGPVGTPNTTANNNVTPTPSDTPYPTVLIVVAVQELKRGMEITNTAVAVRPWPEPFAPRSVFFALEDGSIPPGIIGNFARTDIQREQPILSTMVVQNLSDLASVGSDAAAVLPRGTVAIAVPMDRLTSIGYAIQPGDRVDIIVSLLYVDVDTAFQSMSPNTFAIFFPSGDSGELQFGPEIEGRPDSLSQFGPVIVKPSEEQRPRLVTQRTIQDALVIHVGDFPADGRLFPVIQPTSTPAATATGAAPQQAARGTPVPATTAPPRPDLVTLAVSPQDAVTIVWFIEAKLPITFVLRAVGDSSQIPSQQVTLDYIMQQYRITVPGKTDYAIQPAIRTIRQLIASQEISLSTP